MCTVTFLPDPKGGFILTSNRDEIRLREKAIAPFVYLINDQKLLFPKDPKAGGTWIAVSDKGRAACLLNGAFEPHIPNPPYRKSRGLVVLDSFQYPSPEIFFDEYDFSTIEPFTLVLSDSSNLYEFRWDGNKRHLKSIPEGSSAIWASVTLYPEEIRRKRERWFSEWHSGNEVTIEDIQYFHRFAGDGDSRNDLVINRNDLMITQSITSIRFSPGFPVKMVYQDLLENKTYTFLV